MASFLENAAERFGRPAAESLKKVLVAMDLPDPQEGEFIKGTESNLILLNRYGLVLRVGKALDCAENDLILKPLRPAKLFRDRRTNGTVAIELLPGIDGIVKNKDDVGFIAKNLRARGIRFWDRHGNNCGYLRVKTPHFPHGVPVVLDRGGVRNDDREGRLSAIFNRDGLAGIQERIFASLRESLQKAWPEQAACPDAGGMKAFLDLCAHEIRKGSRSVLSRAWAKNRYTGDDWHLLSDLDNWDPDPHNRKPFRAKRAAAQYEKHLKRRDELSTPTCGA